MPWGPRGHLGVHQQVLRRPLLPQGLPVPPALSVDWSLTSLSRDEKHATRSSLILILPRPPDGASDVANPQDDQGHRTALESSDACDACDGVCKTVKKVLEVNLHARLSCFFFVPKKKMCTGYFLVFPCSWHCE